MSENKITTYPGKDIDVHWDGRLCIHIGECGNSEGGLFVGDRDPWCVPDGCSKVDVREICERCPSGALSYTDKDGSTETAPSENRGTVVYNGPFYLTGDLDLEGAPEDMPGIKHRIALCRCGASKNKPFCDNSHVEAGFQDYGAVGERGQGLENEGGRLGIKPIPNGPVLVEGNLGIRAASGRLAWKGEKAALCRCGASKNKPFCDGSHSKIGFKSE